MILDNRRLLLLCLILLLYADAVNGKNNYKYCCYIARCENLATACSSSTIKINGQTCFQACSSSISCELASTLPGRNESCLRSYLDGPSGPFRYVCDQIFEPGKAPAPPIIRSYEWCRLNCDGWRRVNTTDLIGWAVPLVVYILPAVVFSIVIPRGYKWDRPDRIFGLELNRLPKPLSSCTILILGALILSFDMAVWVFIVFGLAPGPMIAGGLHEALLDWRIVQCINHPSDAEHLNQRDRGALILSVLCGNLDLRINDPLEKLFRLLPPDVSIGVNVQARKEPIGELGREEPVIEKPSDNEENDSCDAPDVGEAGYTNENALGLKCDSTSSAGENDIELIYFNGSPPVAAVTEYATIMTQLECLLRSQQSFGSIVGAPVLFYIGQFIFVIVGLAGDKGDAKAAFGLSFGLWWMSIVHVCIVSGCLLASSNPNPVCGIVASSLYGVPLAENTGKSDIALTLGMSTIHQSHFVPVPLWDRGRMKRLWLRQTSAYAREGFKRKIEPSLLDWIVLLLSSVLLILIPTTLAFIVAYFTPAICMSCRSLTFLVYTLCQIVLIIATVARTRYLVDVDQSGTVARVDIYGEVIRTFRKLGLQGKIVYTVSAILVIAAAILSLITGFGGTIMQMSGVYENCRCSISATTWMNPDGQTFNLAMDSQEDRDSSKYWSSSGYAALLVMGVTTYAGWDYQLGLRENLVSCISRLGLSTSPGKG